MVHHKLIGASPNMVHMTGYYQMLLFAPSILLCDMIERSSKNSEVRHPHTRAR